MSELFKTSEEPKIWLVSVVAIDDVQDLGVFTDRKKCDRFIKKIKGKKYKKKALWLYEFVANDPSKKIVETLLWSKGESWE